MPIAFVKTPARFARAPGEGAGVGRRGPRCFSCRTAACDSSEECEHLSSSQQVLDDHLVERLMIPFGNQPFRLLFVEGPGFFDEAEERTTAIRQMSEPVFRPGGSERMDVEADIFTVPAVSVAFE